MNKLTTIAAAALLALVAGCDTGTVQTKTGTGVGTEVNLGTGYDNVKIVTVKHGDCEFIVFAVMNVGKADSMMHSPTCPNPAHQHQQPVER